MKPLLQQLLVLSVFSTSQITLASESQVITQSELVASPVNQPLEQKNKLTINNCHLDGIKEQVQCGNLLVPEHYSQSDGEQTTIHFAVSPAIDNSDNKTPLIFLASSLG